MSAWHNLWRVTDAIAGPVRLRDGCGGPDPLRTVGQAEPIPDPRGYDAPPGEARRPEILGHSYYTGDPAYAGALRLVMGAMGGAEAPQAGTVAEGSR